MSLRVAFFTGYFPLPSETFVLRQVLDLLARGVDVQVFAAAPPPGAPRPQAWHEHALERRFHPRQAPTDPAGLALALARRVARAPRSVQGALGLASLRELGWRMRPSVPRALSQLDLIAAGRFDVVHAHFGHWGVPLAALRATQPKLRIVTTFHGYDVTVAPGLHGYGMYRRLFQVGDRFTVNSRYLWRRLIALGCPEDRMTQLRMGVSSSEFQCTPRRRTPGEPLRLISIGRLAPMKGFEYAISAVAELVRAGHDVRYRIVGDGELKSRLEAQIAQLGLGERVTLLGALPHEAVRRELASGHLFLLPSAYAPAGQVETQGVVVQEAQASGLPVLVSRIGGVAEGMIDGETGFAFQPESPAAIVQAVEKALSRERDWPEMGRRGRQLVEELFDSQRLADDLLQIYQSISAR